ncbi:MAG: HAD family hydrolase [Candidatus Asgardarchaeia archaeon]
MRIKAVFFDFGGVITERIVAPALEDIVIEFLLKKGINLSEKQCDKIKEIQKGRVKYSLTTLIEIPIEELLHDMMNHIGLSVSMKFIAECVGYFLERVKYELRKNVKEVLLALRKMGLKIGLISNSFTEFPRMVIKKENLYDFFDTIILSKDVRVRKPHPKIFTEALKRASVSANEAIFIGDILEVDVWGAKQVGMKAVLIKSRYNLNKWKNFLKKLTPRPYTKLEPDYTIEDLLEIVDMLENKDYSINNKDTA